MIRFKDISRNAINKNNYHTLESIIAKTENTFVELPLPSLRGVLDESFDKGFLNINKEEHIMFLEEILK